MKLLLQRMSVNSAKLIFRCFVKGIFKPEQMAITCQQYKNIVPICQMLSDFLFFEEDPVRAEAFSLSSCSFLCTNVAFFLIVLSPSEVPSYSYSNRAGIEPEK